MKSVAAGVLKVAYREEGDPQGSAVVLLHGFPYDILAFEEVSALLAEAGCHVFIPSLRGFGATRFLDGNTMRSGQQAALAHDLVAFMDALSIEKALLAGYDWGGRAACIAAALWPERVTALVSCCGYNIQNIPAAVYPEAPENEYRYWYQYYFHGERGRAGLAANRQALCKLLWRLWSPHWPFSEEVYRRSALSFDNPDFVEVVIHSYRHRFGLVQGDPDFDEVERRLAMTPSIAVPTIALHGEADGVIAAEASLRHERHFTGLYERRVLPRVGHNVPQEAPQAFAEAIAGMLCRLVG